MSKAKLVRRTTGGLCVGGALGMLAFGETKPATGGNQLAFAIYWLACFLLVLGAMLMALLDLLAVRSEARRAQRILFEETLVQMQTKKQRRQKDDARSNARGTARPTGK